MADQKSSVMYASATRRFFAYLIDMLILVVLSVIVVKTLIDDIPMQQAVTQVIAALYFILLESSGRMASLGKSAMKIHVAMDEGKKASIASIALRYLLMTLPSVPLLFVVYSHEYIERMQTLQQYVAAHDLQGLKAYVQSPEYLKTGEQFRQMALGSGVLGAALIWLPVVFTKQKTGFHDHLTKTRVFKRADA